MHDLMLAELKDLHSAETQLVKALPKMVKGATTASLRTAFEEHLEQTHEHVARLEQIFEQLGTSPRGKKCKGMEGLLEEGAEMRSRKRAMRTYGTLASSPSNDAMEAAHGTPSATKAGRASGTR